MPRVQWGLIVVGVVSIVLAIVEHFGATFLLAVGTPLALSGFASNCFLLAIALAAVGWVQRSSASPPRAETKPEE